MFMWVHDSFTTWQDLSRLRFNSLGRDVYVSMFLYLVYVCVSHLSQNVNMATQLANKFTTVLKHSKPILLPSSKCHNQICYHTP